MNKRYIPNIDNFLINLTIHPKFQLQFNNKYIYIYRMRDKLVQG